MLRMKKEHQQPTWIWYPGDFEVWLGNRFNNRRTERGAMFPPFWKQDSHWVTVEFSTKVDIDEAETIGVWSEGDFNFMLDGKLLSPASAPDSIYYAAEEPDGGYRIRIPKGAHSLNFKVWNQLTPPALFVAGKTIHSNATWLATYEDKIWIDENGDAHGSGIYVPAASWNFDSPDTPPSAYRLEWREAQPVSSEAVGEGHLFDFGRETFGHLDFHHLAGSGVIAIYYGESSEEALDKEHCETLDRLTVQDGMIPAHQAGTHDAADSPPLGSKAFRYVYVETSGDVTFDLAMYEEYLPYDAEQTGSFECSDELLNHIWQVGAYTMDLTTQEFFMDGIKRDRWTWSGDAIQSYLMNYYLRFNNECVKRTIRQLRGKDPVTAHVNTIMDYTFYWVNSIYDYYLYTGDSAFVREIYPRMQTLMQYVLRRTNQDGMAEGQPDDWIFVDWVDFPMRKRGALAFEQILFARSLQTMQLCASVLRDHPLDTPPQGSLTTDDYAADAERYGQLAADLREKTHRLFWCEEQHAFVHALEDGELNRQVTKFPNMFAMLYDFVSPEEKQTIMEHVMMNPQVERITTPYMRFYELEALCQMGQQTAVLDEIRSYWGGMIAEGATTFWEKYVPEEHGRQHLAMYGRPYGKSLCHAWGAAPVYLFGKYYLGVKPLQPGYETYEVRPVLGGLQWIRGAVPTPFGLIRVEMDADMITVYADGGKGILIAPDGREIDILPQQTIQYPIKKC